MVSCPFKILAAAFRHSAPPACKVSRINGFVSGKYPVLTAHAVTRTRRQRFSLIGQSGNHQQCFSPRRSLAARRERVQA